MEPMTQNRYKCTAGFIHIVGETCGHEVKQGPQVSRYPLPKGPDTVVLDRDNHVVRSYSLHDKQRHARLAEEVI